jgi:hypothetical protein
LVVNFTASSWTTRVGGVLGTSVLVHANTNRIPNAKITLFIIQVLIYPLGYNKVR